MKVDYTETTKARKYYHKRILIADKTLEDWEINTLWGNKAPIIDIKKDGSAISIGLRKAIK